jgi:hypothetical protein
LLIVDVVICYLHCMPHVEDCSEFHRNQPNESKTCEQLICTYVHRFGAAFLTAVDICFSFCVVYQILSYNRNRENHDTGRIYQAPSREEVFECCIQQVSK